MHPDDRHGSDFDRPRSRPSPAAYAPDFVGDPDPAAVSVYSPASDLYRGILGNGLLLNSALYLCGCFVAGMITGTDWAWKASLASMGLAYVSYAIQTAQVLNGSARAPWTTMVTVGVTGLSIAAGIISGCVLLLR